MFADIAGSSELAASMDAEQLRALLGEVYDELSWVVAAYGGTVEKFIGDAVMAVFGVPVSHEDDPERAVRAALVMRSRLGALAQRRGVSLILRIGINTGPVAAGTDPGRDFLVTGEAVNLAARLQQAAEPGEILVGERTFRAVEPVVRTAAPRSLRLKGQHGPVVAFALEGLAPATTYRRRRRPYGPFVGREHELSLVRTLVESSAEHRRPQLVTVIGEPGIGKSRLVEEVVIELQREAQPPAVWIGRCLPYGEGGPYAPLRDLLLRAASVGESDSREEALSKVRGQLLALLGDDGNGHRGRGAAAGAAAGAGARRGRRGTGRARPRGLARPADRDGRDAPGGAGGGGRALGRAGAPEPDRGSHRKRRAGAPDRHLHRPRRAPDRASGLGVGGPQRDHHHARVAGRRRHAAAGAGALQRRPSRRPRRSRWPTATPSSWRRSWPWPARELWAAGCRTPCRG